MNFFCSSNSYVGMRFGSNVFSNLHFQQSNQILQENEGLFLFVTPFQFTSHLEFLVVNGLRFIVHMCMCAYECLGVTYYFSIQAFQLIVFYSKCWKIFITFRAIL
jgi:hypothetical protein